MHCEDLALDTPQLSTDQRIHKIKDELNRLTVPFEINYENTLALTFFDGLCGSESFFVQALYASGQFPCYFVGGSAGGKLDFASAQIYDGRTIAKNKAVMVFVKLADQIKYGLFKSHNFKSTNKSFIIAEADANKRTVSSVIDPDTYEVRSFIDCLCEHFGCTTDGLNAALVKHSFAINVDGDFNIRSVAGIDFDKNQVGFFLRSEFWRSLVSNASHRYRQCHQQRCG